MKIPLLHLIQGLANLFDSLILGLIYVSFLIPVLIEFMLQIGKFIFMPISISLQAVRVILSWVECGYSPFSAKKIINNVADTLMTAAFAVAVIGNLVAPIVFASIAPWIFSLSCLAKTLFHVASAGYYAKCVYDEKLLEKRKEYKAACVENVIGAGMGAIATVAITGVMVFGIVSCAPLGVLLGGLAAGLSVMSIKGSVAELKLQPKFRSSYTLMNFLHGKQKEPKIIFGCVTAGSYPSSGATRHLLPQGEKDSLNFQRLQKIEGSFSPCGRRWRVSAG